MVDIYKHPQSCLYSYHILTRFDMGVDSYYCTASCVCLMKTTKQEAMLHIIKTMREKFPYCVFRVYREPTYSALDLATPDTYAEIHAWALSIAEWAAKEIDCAYISTEILPK